MKAKFKYFSFVIILFIIVYAIACNKGSKNEDATSPTGSINILKFWSDQFPATNTFNYLQGGAGVDGNKVRRIMMGTRSNSTAWAGCEIYVSDQQALSLVKVRFSDVNGGSTLYGNSSINGNIASVSWNTNHFEEIPSEYYLTAWIDKNGNDKVDENEPRNVSDGQFTIVTLSKYNDLVGALNLYASIAFPLPRSRAFALAFLQNSAISYGGNFTSSPISYDVIENDLKESNSYKVGVDLNTSGQAIIRNFYFGANSQLSKDIIASQTFHDTLNQILERNKSYIYQNYCDQTFSIPLSKQLQYLGENVPLLSIDMDLFTTFKTATLVGQMTFKAACKGIGQVVVDSLTIKGKLIDLYDFNYSNNPAIFSNGHKMALIQGGFGTLGKAGQIFRTEVNLDTTIANYQFDFGSCPEPVLGIYRGVYSWDCGPTTGNHGSTPIEFQFIEQISNCNWIRGIAKYLYNGGVTTFTAARFSNTIFDTHGNIKDGTFDPAGKDILININGSSTISVNWYSGKISGTTISGITEGGDYVYNPGGNSACARADGQPAGTFSISK